MWGWLFCLSAVAVFLGADTAGAGAARLICYVGSARADSFSECTHLVYTGNARADKLDILLKEYRKNNPRLKLILRVAETDKDFRALLKTKNIQGLEIHDAHQSLNRTKVLEVVELARSSLSSSAGGPLFLSLPAHPELLAKYYDMRKLVKKVDLLMVETHALGLVKKMTYHPSRLSGLWDMMNTDSVVDLVVGLGVPATKIVISLPATVRQFTLFNETLSTPGSPTVEDEPRVVDQAELCTLLQKGRWTVERDQDLSAPYSFKDKTWMSFEDASSVDVKGKYARIRGLAGIALHDADRDTETTCGPSLRASLAKVLNQQSRAPRAAVLRSLEHEILSAPGHARALDALQVSPYRITQVVDSDGVIHSIREDTRTEFSCSRQGYFVHPRSCARFYRCVKFDQLSPEYTVFEFDCPAGLAFDSRYEVCVWPGSLPHTQACPGSSEIAPVPKTRFICPEHEGFYADPENCRWFFACLDHGKAPLTAYEFRCPFGLGFDAAQLKCDWPWLVPACGNIARYEAEAHGYSAATLTGAAGYQGQTADSINIAGHQSLVSGAAVSNLVGIQTGFLSQADALDSNFIASQELANGATGAHSLQYTSGVPITSGYTEAHGSEYQAGDASLSGKFLNVGLVQPTKYSDEGKYTSGSLILDEYRLPTKADTRFKVTNAGRGYGSAISARLGSDIGRSGEYSIGQNGYSASSIKIGTTGQNIKSQRGSYHDQSGAYVHDPSGDYAIPYRHVDSLTVPYVHDSSIYRDSADSFNTGKYSAASQSGYDGKYTETMNAKGKYVADNRGQYVPNNSGTYLDTNSYNSKGYRFGNYGSTNGYESKYVNDQFNSALNKGTFDSGLYKVEHSGAYTGDSADSYKHEDSGKYKNGVYRIDGHIGNSNGGIDKGSVFSKYHGSYSAANVDKYLTNSNAYAGGSHTLTAGAVNVELVGKTTLVDTEYNDQSNYQGVTNQVSFGHRTLHPGHVSLVSQPAVDINHIGTDENNLDGYSFVTTPTSSGVPTTATPFAVTTSLPAVSTYKTTYIPETPKSTIKEIFGYSQPAVTLIQPTVIPIAQVSSNIQHTTSQNLGYNYRISNNQLQKSGQTDNFEGTGYDYKNKAESQSAINAESLGYDYSRPSIQFQEGTTYATSAPNGYRPQGFAHSQQTVHKVESLGFGYSTPVSEEPFKKLVAYTTGPSYQVHAPTTYKPQAFSHQTIHKVENSNPQTTGQIATEHVSEIAYQEPHILHYSTPQPAVALQPVLSTYQPQVISHQTVHNVDTSHINQGNTYNTPIIENDKVQAIYYTTPAPIVSSTYKPRTFSHQTIDNVESYASPVFPTSIPKIQLTYQAPITSYDNPLLKYTEKVNPITYKRPSHTSQAFSQQTIHKFTNSQSHSPEIINDFARVPFIVPASHEEPELVYTTAQPIFQSVISTQQPQLNIQQTLYEVDTSQFEGHSENNEPGYKYNKPNIVFEDVKAGVEYSTAAPVISTYRPQVYSHQTVHKVQTQKFVPISSTVAPTIDHVSKYENPFLKYINKVTPTTFIKPTATAYSETYQPIIEQHAVTHIVGQPARYEDQKLYTEQNLQIGQEGYSYNQPEIQRNIESSNTAYSDASVVSHQTFNLANTNSDLGNGNGVVFVSTSPSTLTYEDHSTSYAAPGQIQTYQSRDYIPPKYDYEQSYTLSTTPAPVIHQSSITPKLQSHFEYRPVEHSQQYEIVQNVPTKQVAFSTTHTQQQDNIGSLHLSPYPGTSITTKYKQGTYENPEIQVAYKAEEYLPPVVSTTVTPILTSTYRPRYYSTTPITQEYLSPANDNNYSYASTTTKFFRPTTQSYNYVEAATSSKAPEYLPPAESNNAKLVQFENFGFNKNELSSSNVNPYQDYSVPKETVQRKQNIVVQTAKFNQLGFGTVGPDAGLVSTASYTTAAPIIIETTSRPYAKFTTREPSYSRVHSTSEYNAPEYLPPSEEVKSDVSFKNYGISTGISSSDEKYNQYEEQVQLTAVPKRKNIVVETAKSHLLGFGTIGNDAGLVSPVSYTTVSPITASSAEYSSLSPNFVSSTYETPVEQGLFRVTPANTPIRRPKPQVAIVTKINDFNPLLVRKLGAVCSCQSPVLVLKGRRPTVKQPDHNSDSDNIDVDSIDIDSGDISDSHWAQKSIIAHTPTNLSPVVTSTFNPIIVPDDSYYQDYQEHINQQLVVTPKKELYSPRYVSSTPVAVKLTGKAIRGRPRINAVTVAPTYESVFLNQKVSPTSADESEFVQYSGIDTQAFDRYGPGGLRSRDETLQGSVDCKRAGLFRHPKQCNKFYACRWDCTKQRFTLHVFNCPIQLSFDPSIGACNWPSQGPACQGDTLLTNAL